MKKVLPALVIILSMNNLHAQKRGYEDILLNNNLAIVEASHKYHIHQDITQKDNWIITGDSLMFHSTLVKFIKVNVDKKKIIKTITLHTKEKTFDDSQDWAYDLKYILNDINGDLNKYNSDDLSRPLDRELKFAWSFADTKTALMFFVPKVNPSSVKFSSSYTFIWTEDPQHMADLKF